MINTNELMLGNYVELSNGNIVRIKRINEVNISYYDNSIDQYLDVMFKDIYPIPITEEILEKCGFYKCDRLNNMPANYYSNDEGNKIGYHKESDKYLLIGMYCEFKYLHELQNIYYLLTKKQLNVNLND